MTQSPLEVDLGVGCPVAFTGLRRLLRALQEQSPSLVKERAARHPAEWNELFPGDYQGAPSLMDLALTPSERRLHRESEQTFWVLNFAARLILDVLAGSGRPLHLTHLGEADLPTVRAVMRAVEWGRIDGLDRLITTSGWELQPRLVADLFAPKRRAYLESAAKRMKVPLGPAGPVGLADRPLEAPVDGEGRFLHAVLDEAGSAERRVAAAVLAIRSCFFSTNYEGATLAAERALGLLRQPVSAQGVFAAWEELDTKLTTPAIEIDRESLGGQEELKALFHRCLGVLHAFTGSHDSSMASFAAGLDCDIPPEGKAHLRMFRGLLSIKRMGELPNARREVEQGLAELKDRPGAMPTLHEGWLRNVYALTYFQEKNLEDALKQEVLAMKCVGDLHDASATHLKINLISNISVVQETAKRFNDAVATWRRYEKFSQNWGDNFSKHHRYRLGGLTLRGGDVEGGRSWYEQAYQSAEKLGDALHRQFIAAEQGRASLDERKPEVAQEWFVRAVDHAQQIGDPLQIAQSLAGLELSRGGKDFSEPARIAQLTSTDPAGAQRLLAALEKGGEDLQAALPPPRTKLNRPFDLVNLTA